MYEQFINWLKTNWITAVLLLAAAGLIALPKVRDGAVLLYSWAKRPFKKGSQSREEGPIAYEVSGEKVSFTELIRSIDFDAVKVHAITHRVGISAEYEWLKRRYPGYKLITQQLTSLQALAGDVNFSLDQIPFDLLTINLPDGRAERDIL